MRVRGPGASKVGQSRRDRRDVPVDNLLAVRGGQALAAVAIRRIASLGRNSIACPSSLHSIGMQPQIANRDAFLRNAETGL